MRKTLGVFAKWPEPGKVKTRLGSQVGLNQSAEIYEAMLFDFLDRCAALPFELVLACSPAEKLNAFSDKVDPRFQITAQADGDLGRRMESFFSQQSSPGNRVVLVGSDAPDLPVGRISQAFDKLALNDLVLGPSEDGGYYLIGMRGCHRILFRDIPWSTAAVWSATLARANQSGLELATLDAWSDVDELDDWLQFRDRIDSLPIDQFTRCRQLGH